MTIRLSPLNPFAFILFVGAFVYHSTATSAQCTGEFAFQSFPSDGNSATGKIELSVKNPDSSVYTFKVYSVAGEIKLVQSREGYAPDKIIFEDLVPATYFVKVEWAETCYRTLGGMEGILITEKDQEK